MWTPPSYVQLCIYPLHPSVMCWEEQQTICSGQSLLPKHHGQLAPGLSHHEFGIYFSDDSGELRSARPNDCTQESQRHPSCLFLITCHNGLSSFEKRTWLCVCFSYFHVCYLGVVHTLGLFGCATGKVALTGDPKMSLVFPPGGFRRCRVCTGVDSSKIPLPLPPVETITEQWATSNIPCSCLHVPYVRDSSPSNT